MTSKFLIYGAYGYTGTLCIKHAISQGLKENLIIAGRRNGPLQKLAKKYNLAPEQVYAFPLTDTKTLNSLVSTVKVVLHIAGPFIDTYKPVVEACLKHGVHYLDVTGEVDVFEAIAKLDQEAKNKNVFLIPGVGFDVVPTDCLAAQLKGKLPDATELKLAFTSSDNSGISAGTLKTGVRAIAKHGSYMLARVNHKISRVKPTFETKEIICDLQNKKKAHIMQTIWGDVSTAYYSTGIPNIHTYMGGSGSVARFMAWVAFFLYWMHWLPLFPQILDRLISWLIKGPSNQQLENTRMHVWGEVKNSKGKIVRGTLSTPNGYQFTMLSAILVVQKLLKGEVVTKEKGGFKTPSLAFGPGFVQEVAGVSQTVFEEHE